MVSWEATMGARSISPAPSGALWSRLEPPKKQLMLLPLLPFSAFRINHQFSRQLRICKLEALELATSSALSAIEEEERSDESDDSLPTSEGNFSPLVTYLLDLGMNMEEIEGVVRKFPAFVKHKLDSDIKPAVDFLLTAGVKPQDMPRIICRRPQLITSSMENIKSRVHYLREIGMNEEQFSMAISRSPSLLSNSLLKTETIINYLRGIGLSDTKIAGILARAPQIIGMSIKDNLMPTVEYFESIGLDASLLIQKSPEAFGLCIESKLKLVVEFFLKKGFTLEELHTIVNRFPKVFTLSIEHNLVTKWEYFTVMGYAREELIKYPNYFGFSLERRIKPRYESMTNLGVRLLLSYLLFASPTKFEKLMRKEVEKKKKNSF